MGNKKGIKKWKFRETSAANNAYAYRSLARGFGGLTGVQGGLSAALIVKEGAKALPMSAFATGPVAVPTALFGVGYLKNKKRLSTKMDADPLAFNYNYRMVTRKHKDPKVPVHMSSNELYWEHHRNKHK